MEAKVGLWIDHRQAIVVAVTDRGEEIGLVISAIEKQARRSQSSRIWVPMNHNRYRQMKKALAGKSALNCLETAGSPLQKDRGRNNGVGRVLCALLFSNDQEAPRQIILDFDATDDPLHGRQEGRFFHADYDCYCYLPLYVFCWDHLGRDLSQRYLEAVSVAAERPRP